MTVELSEKERDELLHALRVHIFRMSKVPASETLLETLRVLQTKLRQIE